MVDVADSNRTPVPSPAAREGCSPKPFTKFNARKIHINPIKNHSVHAGHAHLGLAISWAIALVTIAGAA
jgi:hypothetical protein